MMDKQLFKPFIHLLVTGLLFFLLNTPAFSQQVDDVYGSTQLC